MQFSAKFEHIEQYADKPVNTAVDNFVLPYSGSLKSRSLKTECDNFQSSFQKGFEEIHVETVWESSIKFLKSSIRSQLDFQLGMNNPSLFCFLYFPQETLEYQEQIDINKLINDNKFIKPQDKGQWIKDLQSQPDLTNFLIALRKKFNLAIFQEFLLIVKTIWEKYLDYKHENKIPQEWEPIIHPRILDFQEENFDEIKEEKFLETQPYSMLKSADLSSKQLAHSFYICSHIEILNLRQADATKQDERIVCANFVEFIKDIARAVYCCVQGVFYQPEKPPCSLSLHPLVKKSQSDLSDVDEENLSSFGELRKITPDS